MAQTSIPTESDDRNLINLLGAVTASLRERNAAPLGELMSENVVWDGVYPGQRCSDRETALGFLNRAFADPPRIDRLEASSAGAAVTITASGEGLYENLPDGERVRRPSRTMVFTFKDGRIVHIQGA